MPLLPIILGFFLKSWPPLLCKFVEKYPVHLPIPISMISFIPALFLQDHIYSSLFLQDFISSIFQPLFLQAFISISFLPPGSYLLQPPSSWVALIPATWNLLLLQAFIYSSPLQLPSHPGFYLFQPPSTYFYSSVSFIPACSIPFSSRVWYILPPIQNFLPFFHDISSLHFPALPFPGFH